ncbi:MAG TPA: acetylornithine carbamoyltransferase, partial [Chitinophagales bacterium]|nr:acetylornithine carbamoyltransferase [Chitinophagales bacterium]
ELAEQFSGKATIEYNQDKALEGADFVYAKNWSSYRQYGQLLGQHDDWMITDQKMQLTDKAYFMHCLPTRRNLEIADDVLDSDYSLVIKEAANREFAAQAVLKNILESL